MLLNGVLTESIHPLPYTQDADVRQNRPLTPASSIPDFFPLLHHLSPNLPTLELCNAYHHLVDCIVNTTPTLLYVYDFVAQRNVWSNAPYQRFWEKLLGMAMTVTNPSELFAFIHPDDQPLLSNVIRTLQLTVGAECTEVEYRIRLPDGRYCWFWDRIAVLQRNDQGVVVQIIGSMLEITERVHAIQALQESEDKYRLVVTSMREGIVLQYRDGRITACNVAAEQMLGLTADQMMGRTSLDPRWHAIHADGSPFPGEMHPAMVSLRTGQPQIDVVMGIHKPNDTLTWILVSSQPLFYAGETAPYAAVATFQDITERKRLENRSRQAQKMEAIGTLAGGIAHDFNNILTPILGYAELAMRQSATDPKLQRNLERIVEAGQRAKGLVRQILAFSRQVESEQCAVALAPLIMEALALLRHTIPTTINIQPDLQADAGLVFADPSQLHQIIMNLFTNAYQAIGETHGQITITLVQVQMPHEPDTIYQDILPGDYVKLTVRDTGIGMDQATISRIFDPFFTTKGVGKGTGLGLSVVHGLVQALHGMMDVQSEVGKGTIFTLYLPCYEPPVVERRVANAVDPLVHGSERILLVDDEQPVTEVLQQQLESYGYQVAISNMGAVALALFQQTPHAFDLIIVDQIMPGLTGDQFIDAVLKIRPTIPIIMLSGYSERFSPQHTDIVGVNCFLYKPVDAVLLCKSIRQALLTVPQND